MNIIFTTGRIEQVKRKTSKNNREYATFFLMMPVRNGFRESELRKSCTIWFADKIDDKIMHVVDGATVAIVGEIEAYSTESDGKTYVNEKLIVRQIEQIAPPIASFGGKNEVDEDKDKIPF
jgi:hypothetical protein